MSFTGFAQTQNVNPDKNGEPWILGGFRVPSDKEINKIPQKTLTEKYRGKELPTSFDNSTQPYFRPIFSQTDGCCAQASGIAYVYTYESNYVRGTSASTAQNQYPTHYTYNFLNSGDGANGSWMADGWNIVKANGCPTVQTYGGLYQNATYWMSGYNNYESGQTNRIDELFSIDVSTVEGIETLKHWMYDHLEGADAGGIVSFAAGINNDGFNMTYNNIITSWGNSVNHAMTFVGWDDDVEYDYNNDGQITTDLDINDDGIVDLKDCEKGALLMVNSWGTYWGDGGFAHVMYKLLAEPIENGGIMSGQVFGVTAKETCEPVMFANIKLDHNSRNKIKVSFGIASDISASEPEEVYNLPFISYQGGDYDMRGTSSSPMEATIDITSLLSGIESGDEVKIFLLINEQDPYNEGNGQIYNFSITDGTNTWTCTEQNVNIINNDITNISIIANPVFDAPEITTVSFSPAYTNNYFEQQLEAEGGSEPYKWNVYVNYDEQTESMSFPSGVNTELTPTSNDDGTTTQELDFSFPFYGELFNEIVISTDGSILFDEGFGYIRSEESIRSNRVIGVFASDLLISDTGDDGIFYSGNSDYAIIRWKTSLFGNEDANIEAAVKLYPDGNIEFFYGDDITGGISWASGISNGQGSSTIAEISGTYDPSETQHQMLPEPFPFGMEINQNGLFSGIIPENPATWDIHFTVTDNNNLSAEKVLTLNSTISGIDKNLSAFNFEIQPNIIKTGTNLKFNSTNSESVIIEMYNISGQKVISKNIENIKAGNNTIYLNIDTENITEGIYLVKILQEQKTAVKKVIVQK